MNIGIVGTGMIIQNAGDAIKAQPEFSITAIVSRPHSAEKARVLAEQFEIPKIYTNYEEFLEDSQIDVVYIGIINSEHYSYAKRAILSGKHVIVEKPFTVRLKEAKELADLARRRQVILLEAIHFRYHPWLKAVEEGLEAIGQIKMVECSYSKISSRYQEYKKGNVLPVFDPNLGGGALYDIGVYCVHFADAALGERYGTPEIHYEANKGFNGVDTSGVLLLKYPEALAVCVCGKDSDGACQATVQGEAGSLMVDGFPRPEKVILRCHGQGKRVLWKSERKETNPLYKEFEAFASLLSDGNREQAERQMEKSLRVMAVLDAAYYGERAGSM